MEKYADQPFAIVGVNSDDDLAELAKVREKERITWRSFWNGPQGTQGPISKAWNVRGWPTLYVIDAAGVIRYKSVGANEDALDAMLASLLAQTEPPAAPVK
ncbi:MAG: TlpA family protein disulfide reductase [Planctomycetes bacterium]|nr:TlpA family protein disulfide reductase [Planctomycetota bacterium]